MADLGEDTHGGVGVLALDFADCLQGDFAVFLHAIPAHFCGVPGFRQLDRQAGADAFGVLVSLVLTSLFYHLASSEPVASDVQARNARPTRRRVCHPEHVEGSLPSAGERVRVRGTGVVNGAVLA